MRNIENFSDIITYDFSNDLFEQLYELSDVQWHEYNKICDDVNDKLSIWILKNLGNILQSIDNVEKLSFIIGALGLSSVYDFIYNNIEILVLSNDVKVELLEMLSEFKDDIDDCYSGIK
ncbi:MAG: hypothetical protein Q4B79_06250 [Moraxella sp.]|uniref:hypothetical protein n=1 Tax=Moraxella sp. TaxID=479 RepID=UPI0026DA91E3|nr:hypothetical protein [Moraxella sp.]MDO4450540.1 hypothetical protein [Moraxella sp.]